MKVKLAVILSVTLVLMTGCLDKENIPTPTATETSPIAANPAPAKPTFTSEDVVKLLNTQGLELMPPSKKEGFPTLNGILPIEFTISKPTEDTMRVEYISIYIFRDVKESYKGLEEFNKEKEKYNMVVPSVWQNGNVLVFYGHSTPLGENTAFEEQINNALAGWNVIYKHQSLDSNNEIAAADLMGSVKVDNLGKHAVVTYRFTNQSKKTITIVGGARYKLLKNNKVIEEGSVPIKDYIDLKPGEVYEDTKSFSDLKGAYSVQVEWGKTVVTADFVGN
ncbi:hypothetical protein ASG89_20560 [Paenibacillus sp. Soil766]|uniref:hypothetical protein n=1 Tax=Paenibacillus sp. Soil766 TaxID=1736404 RepID=UPI00070E5664|nr:hypothetical protein [Paenibacillus sp. Soil766]KRF05523.1 hypothetical protein ASG89_20560 [Paenibacillus sp. Soil766]